MRTNFAKIRPNAHEFRINAKAEVLYWTYSRRWFRDSLNFPPWSLSAQFRGVAPLARPQFPALACADVFADGAAGTQARVQIRNERAFVGECKVQREFDEVCKIH